MKYIVITERYINNFSNNWPIIVVGYSLEGEELGYKSFSMREEDFEEQWDDFFLCAVFDTIKEANEMILNLVKYDLETEDDQDPAMKHLAPLCDTIIRLVKVEK